MRTDVSIYHNPKCSKSRATLALLRERGVEPTIIEYLDEGVDAARVAELIAQLGCDPHALVRSKEAEYAGSGLSKDSTVDEVAEAIARFPRLLERPVVVAGGRAAIGRPPENVLTIL